MSLAKTAIFWSIAILVPLLAGYARQSFVWPLANILFLSAQNVALGWRVNEDAGAYRSFFSGIAVAAVFVLPSFFIGYYFGGN